MASRATSSAWRPRRCPTRAPAGSASPCTRAASPRPTGRCAGACSPGSCPGDRVRRLRHRRRRRRRRHRRRRRRPRLRHRRLGQLPVRGRVGPRDHGPLVRRSRRPRPHPGGGPADGPRHRLPGTSPRLGLDPAATILVNGAGSTIGFAAVQIALAPRPAGDRHRRRHLRPAAARPRRRRHRLRRRRGAAGQGDQRRPGRPRPRHRPGRRRAARPGRDRRRRSQARAHDLRRRGGSELGVRDTFHEAPAC